MGTNIYRANAHDDASLEELALYHLINEYREGLGLPEIALSKGLTATAGRHVVDTRDNIWGEDLDLPSGANLHSWSDAYYYSDHRDPSVMWEAPQRLGTGYDDDGYEISAAGYADIEAALAGWKSSPGHNAVLANLGSWSSVDFNAMGVGVETAPGDGPYGGRVYHVWFGRDADPDGPPQILGSSDGDKIRGTSFKDIIKGDGGGDAIYGRDGQDRLSGGGGGDDIDGGSGSDRIYGGGGGDLLEGRSGHDRLKGGGGDDNLKGGKGDDTLVGGNGADTLLGGPGEDVFAFFNQGESRPGALRDRLRDFLGGEDHVDLRKFDGDATRDGRQRLDFIGREDFSGTAGELRSDGGVLSADTNGDGLSDFEVRTVGVGALGADDILI